MNNHWLGNNNQGLAIVRVSSRRQEGNISHETQEKEIREYCQRNGIQIRRTVKIVESARNSEDRKKYSAAIASALTDDIRHLLFYMYDREARNLTDNEKNEQLVKAGLICLHYVRENKVLHKDSPDSEFFIRDVQAAANKQFIRNLSAKVVDAMKQKAESGWYPSNNVPLGYALQKLRDENGKELKRGAVIVRDPDEKKVAQVTREFELRAMGYTYNQIREAIIAEGFIAPEKITQYNRATIEHRIYNPFYEGRFHWQGVEYKGKHPIIIPRAILEAAKAPKRGFKKLRPDMTHGVLAGGWLKCATCHCNVVYEKKTKVAKYKGTVLHFHYYHCSNGRRMHSTLKGLNVSEANVWEQFDEAVDSISVSPQLARQIADALNETHRSSLSAMAHKIQEAKSNLRALEAREDRAYEDMVAGILDTDAYRRQLQRIRLERNRSQGVLNQYQSQMTGSYRETAESILELSKDAKVLYLSRSPAERRDFLERVLSNPVLDGTTVRYDLKKPFSTLAEMKKNEEWRALLGNFRTDCAALQGGKSLEDDADLDLSIHTNTDSE